MPDEIPQTAVDSAEANKTIKGFAHCHGDPSVGIFATTAEFDTGLTEFSDVDERNRARSLFEDAYGVLWDGCVVITFADECELCNTIKPRHRPGCPDYILREVKSHDS